MQTIDWDSILEEAIDNSERETAWPWHPNLQEEDIVEPAEPPLENHSPYWWREPLSLHIIPATALVLFVIGASGAYILFVLVIGYLAGVAK